MSNELKQIFFEIAKGKITDTVDLLIYLKLNYRILDKIEETDIQFIGEFLDELNENI